MKIKILILFLLCTFTINVQASTVEEDIENLNTKLSTIEDDLFLKAHPIESIYITTKEDESTEEEMASKYGGKWEVYGENKVLKSTTGTAGSIGGNSQVKLNADNLPSHTHSFTPNGTISSTFTGTRTTTGNNSVALAADSFSGTTSSTSKTLTGTIQMHSAASYTNIHGLAGIFSSDVYNSSYFGVMTALSGAGSQGIIKIDATHTHGVTGTVTLNNTVHTHSYTAKGDIVNETFKGTEGTTGSAGKDASSISTVNVLDPYITVYMYKRTA